MRSSRSPYLAPRPLPEAPSDAASVLLLLLILAAVVAGWLVVQLGPPPLPERWPGWTELQTVALLQPGPVPPAPTPADLPRVAAWGAWLLVVAILAARLLLVAALGDTQAQTIGGVLRGAVRRAVGALVLLFLVRLPEWPLTVPTPQQLVDATRGGPVPIDGLVAVGVLVAWLAWLWWTTTIVVRGLVLGWAAMPRRQPTADDELDLLGLVGLLLGLAGAAWLLFVLTGVPHVPRLPTELPSWGALLVLLRSPVPPMDGVIEVLGVICWLAWVYLAGTLGLHLVAVTALLVTRGATWARGLGALSDRISPRLVRRAVSVAFVVQLVVRPTAAGAAPVTEPPVAEVRWAQPPTSNGIGPTVGVEWSAAADADEAVDPGLVRHTVRKGDTLWSMAEYHLGQGDDYSLIKEANRGRRMPDGSVYDGISNTIYQDWVFEIPEPNRAVEVSGDKRIYTTVPGDTLEGIAARLLGGYERWRELWALNAGSRTADGRVLDHPDQLPSGLRLRMPADTPLAPSAVAGTANEQTADAEQVAGQETADLLYTVQPGDTVWAIAEQFYDVAGAAATRDAVDRIAAANLGHRQPGGGVFEDPDQVVPGWTLHIPSPTRGIEIDADGVWYVVQDGDTLSSISARLLGHPQRWPELFARNRGRARTPDGRRLEDPNQIWKDLRLLLIPATAAPATTESPAPPAAEAPRPTARPPTADVSAPPPPPPTQSPEPPAPAPNPAAKPSAWTVSTPEPPVPETPVRAEPGEPSPLEWDPLPLAASAAGIGLAAVLFGMRYSRRAPARRTGMVELDDAGTSVRPVTLLAGGDDDPNDVGFTERLAGALLRRAGRAGLKGVGVLSASVGSSVPVVVLAVPRAGRAALEAVLRSATDLARRIDVNASSDSELIVRLEGVHPEALERIAARARPLLLCVGLLPDGRAWLVGWAALGHLLVASEPGTIHAGEHLAALVASLAARRPPDRLRLYTLAAADDALGQLAPLPHQSAVVDASDAAACLRVLASLRAEVDRRIAARVGGRPDGVPALWSELVLVLAELGTVADSDDLAYLLMHGSQAGLRVLAATADRAISLGPLVATFNARFVFGLDDEELSMALLGTPAALSLCGPARLLARLGDRPAIEVSGARLDDGAREELLTALDGFGPTAADAVAPRTAAPAPSPQTDPGLAAEPVERDGNPTPVSAQAPSPAPGPADLTSVDSDGTVGSLIDADTVPGIGARNGTSHQNGPNSSAGPFVQVESPSVSEDDQPPPAVALLAARAQVVVTCADAGVWHAGQRLALPEGRARELLLRLAAAPALADPAANHRARIVAELRQERDGARRDEDNAALAWLNVTGKRLGALLAETLKLDAAAREGWNRLLVVDRGTGVVSLRSELVLSDVQAFVTAAARAVDTTLERAERVAAAEEMLALGLPLLGEVGPRVLPDDLPVQVQERLGSAVPTYGWARQDAWERGAPSYLLALWNESALSLARAYRDSGRYTAAVDVYAMLLDRDPHLDNAQQGLLLAAAGIGDTAGIEAAWERVRSAWDGDVPDDLQDLRDRLRREVTVVRRAGR